METHFASLERTSIEDLNSEVKIISSDPLVSGILNSISGLLIVLDRNRQIVSINDSLMRKLGIKNPEDALGLRLGESLKCIHAYKEPDGCGTTEFCSNCGAAIAMVSGLTENKSSEQLCVISSNKNSIPQDIVLLVKSHPLDIKSKRFLLIFLQDITREQQRAALERTFFHDIKNMLAGLIGATELLALKGIEPKLVSVILRSSLRLKNEIEIQKSLLTSELDMYKPKWITTNSLYILEEFESFFINHPMKKNKILQFKLHESAITFKTDVSLLLRVLCNMLTNAFESTEENGLVKVWVENDHPKFLSFFVWNNTVIPKDISIRIFQRNFSTKKGSGRGVGTYSMKLFGEKILGGKVSFISTKEEGTIFRITLPL